jgi:hypothetical protein
MWLIAPQDRAVPKAELTAIKSRTYDQVAAEPEAGFPEAEAYEGGQSDLGEGALFLFTFFGRAKKVK